MATAADTLYEYLAAHPPERKGWPVLRTAESRRRPLGTTHHTTSHPCQAHPVLFFLLPPSRLPILLAPLLADAAVASILCACDPWTNRPLALRVLPPTLVFLPLHPRLLHPATRAQKLLSGTHIHLIACRSLVDKPRAVRQPQTSPLIYINLVPWPSETPETPSPDLDRFPHSSERETVSALRPPLADADSCPGSDDRLPPRTRDTSFIFRNASPS